MDFSPQRDDIAANDARYHVPVMAGEIIEFLNPRPGQTLVDATLGGGGHSRLLRSRLGGDGLLIGIDQDAEAIEAATAALGAEEGSGVARFIAVQARFDSLSQVLADSGVSSVDGVLFDLGVSSHQLDDARRGFSFKDPLMPLDMRMNAAEETSDAGTAAGVLATYDKNELTRIFRDYADEKWAARIAEFVVRDREDAPITTVGQLVNSINRAVPAGARKASGIHPATRVFQALRIAVNDEYRVLESGLEQAIKALKPASGARIAVLSYHSGEDRIVKRAFQKHAGQARCVCPPAQPICTCRDTENTRDLEIITKKPVEPSGEEVSNNPRARSAKLRVAAKL